MARTFNVYDATGKPILVNQVAPILLTDLTPNTTYKGYYVSPSDDLSTKSYVDDIVTADEVPSAPTIAVTAGNGQVTFVITPGDDAGTAVTGYRVYYASQTDTDMTAVDVAATGTIDELMNDTAYTFEAVAINNAGESERSTDVTITPSDPTATS